MAWVCRCVVIRLVATYAGIWRSGIIPVDVAQVALVADGSMCPCQRIDRTVIKRRRRPGSLRVAVGACIGELLDFMVWIKGIVVISLVTAYTGVGRIGIVAIMAIDTLAGNSQVGTFQHIEIIVVRHGSRLPSWCCGMAGCTIGRQV